jgi:hypothetical protein
MERSPGDEPQVSREVDVEPVTHRAYPDPQVIREIQADALKQQARLWLAGPTPKEPSRLRRWLRSA